LKLESTKGVGSTFTLYLPLSSKDHPDSNSAIPLDRQDPSTSKDPELTEDEVAVGQDNTVLIIEDDKKFAAVLQTMVHKKNLKGIIANDGESGIKAAQKYRPQAIILDIGLPDMDGYTVLERLKRIPSAGDIPVHIISGTPIDERQFLQKGAIRFLKKPANVDQLEALISSFKEKRNFKEILIIGNKDFVKTELVKLESDPSLNIVSEIPKAAQSTLKNNKKDCIIIDLSSKDRDLEDFIEMLKTEEVHKSVP